MLFVFVVLLHDRRRIVHVKVGIIYGFQNAAMVGDKAARVDTFANLGVRCIQLTYNPLNQLGRGSMAPGDPGLTPFGREVADLSGAVGGWLSSHRASSRLLRFPVEVPRSISLSPRVAGRRCASGDPGAEAPGLHARNVAETGAA